MFKSIKLLWNILYNNDISFKYKFIVIFLLIRLFDYSIIYRVVHICYESCEVKGLFKGLNKVERLQLEKEIHLSRL